MIFSSKLLSAFLVVAASTTDAFVTKSSSASQAVRQSETSLNAMPPLIIGPMLKKMREEKLKKQQPMATEAEIKAEAPGLRVGDSTWKWPPVWPYDRNFFLPKDDIPKANPAANPMADMMAGGAPTPPQPQMIEVEKLDPIEYWQVEMADVKTEMDEDAAERLTR